MDVVVVVVLVSSEQKVGQAQKDNSERKGLNKKDKNTKQVLFNYFYKKL